MSHYLAHCTKCGEVTNADRLAFDFGELINKAILKAASRQFGADNKWEPLVGLDFRLYYTCRDLEQIYKLRGGESCKFIFTVKQLRFQIQRFAKVQFGSLVGKDTDTIEYNNLIQRVKFRDQYGKDVDVQELASKIKEVVDLCSKQKSPDENEIIAQFNVRIVMIDDDCGNKFAKKLEIEYEDGIYQNVTSNVCPNCGKKFYPEVGRYEEIIIAMAGSARVGKTAYLAALVYNLIEKKNGVASVIEAKNEDWEFFRSVILEKFRNGEKIDKTAFEGGGETIPLFSIQIKVFDKNYIFTFIDMPGEAFDNPEETEGDAGINFIINERRIIKYAQMIWFCVAPEQIDADIAKMRKITNLQQDAVNTKTAQVMANIRSTMQAVNMDRRMNAAVLVTMSDQIFGDDAPEGLFAPSVNVCEEYIVKGCLDYQKTSEFCELSKGYLEHAVDIVNTINDIFRGYSVFAVAAYGQNLPNANQEEMELLNLIGQNDAALNGRGGITPIPSMVELPFLWTLATLGKISEVEQVPKYETRRRFFRSETVCVGEKSEQVPEYKLFQQINEE